jgi:hypothetical protein
MAVNVQMANRLRKDCNPTAVERHFNCISTAPTIPNSAALSTVAGVRRFTRTQARRGGKRHGGTVVGMERIWTWIQIRIG